MPLRDPLRATPLSRADDARKASSRRPATRRDALRSCPWASTPAGRGDGYEVCGLSARPAAQRRPPRAVPSPFPPAEEPLAALLQEGWEVSLTAAAPGWLVRATRGNVTVEGGGAPEAEVLFDACRRAFQGGRA